MKLDAHVYVINTFHNYFEFWTKVLYDIYYILKEIMNYLNFPIHESKFSMH